MATLSTTSANSSTPIPSVSKAKSNSKAFSSTMSTGRSSAASTTHAPSTTTTDSAPPTSSTPTLPPKSASNSLNGQASTTHSLPNARLSSPPTGKSPTHSSSLSASTSSNKTTHFLSFCHVAIAPIAQYATHRPISLRSIRAFGALLPLAIRAFGAPYFATLNTGS